MTIREALAALLVAVADRIDPPKASDDIVTVPMTSAGQWPLNTPPAFQSWSSCPRCGQMHGATGVHLCPTVFPGSTAITLTAN